VLGRRNAPFLVEKPERHRPELLVLIDVGASRMVALEAVEPGRPASAVAEWADPEVEGGVTGERSWAPLPQVLDASVAKLGLRWRCSPSV
jgi:hypothetical protein